MSDFEVPEPILCSPFDEPTRHWYIQEGEAPELRAGRRPSVVFPPEGKRAEWGRDGENLFPSSEYPGGFRLELVNTIRGQLAKWRAEGWPGATRTTLELLKHWGRGGRRWPLFFAQREAAETVIFLTEARQDFLQGVAVPRDEPGGGVPSFRRYACKMATGAGKTTVMAMVAGWSILNKINAPNDARFSDVVLAVCPNVTIRDRLREIDPRAGEASVYRTRDLVPPGLMDDLTQGRVIVMNWHTFEPHATQVGGESARVVRAGRPVTTRETVHIGEKTTTARGKRYLTLADFQRQRDAGMLRVVDPLAEGETPARVEVEVTRYVESDTALVNRLLSREVGGKRNILVLNDEAHHAYRIHREDPDADDLFAGEEDAEDLRHEATVWVEGLDRIHKLRGINFCVDLSATPYHLGATGRDAGKPFPWTVSDFGLVDAIESGLVKVPQLALRDTTGAERPAYFNIWRWVMEKMTAAERGGRKGQPKPEAVLKYAHHPIAMLGAMWAQDLKAWEERKDGDARPPVFIIVCKNTQLARVMFDWLANGECPAGVPPLKVDGFRNTEGDTATIRVDSKVVHETDTGEAKGDEARWMRFTLDTVGRTSWPADPQGRPVYPEGFEELAAKMCRPPHPPGRDVRCIVSVGMLTEGWDCNTVSHVVGLRPFMSQLLCEQVVGRGLRRRSYDIGPGGLLAEEVAQVLGVPFEVVPFKAKGEKPSTVPMPHHVRAMPHRLQYAITFPRVEGYSQAVRSRVAVDWPAVPALTMLPDQIPPEVQMKGLSLSNEGRLTLSGPGRLAGASLAAWREGRRVQELVFDLAQALTREMTKGGDTVPAHVLFPQLVPIINRFLSEKVRVRHPADIRDVFLAPYFGWVLEALRAAIRPDTSAGEAPEVARYEESRKAGCTTDVNFWTRKDVREAVKCHLNFVVCDTEKWEQSAAYLIDTHKATKAFVKNDHLGFAIPYFHDGQDREYYPDFLIRLEAPGVHHLILETKGYDPLEEAKRAAAERWVSAVNARGGYGRWRYALVKDPANVGLVLEAALAWACMPAK